MRVASCAVSPCPEFSKIRVASYKLSQEAEVVLEEEADVVDAVLQHGHALHAHAEGPPRDLFRVVADVAEDLGMDHARAEDLQPSRLLADATALTTTEEATHGDLGRRPGDGNGR